MLEYERKSPSTVMARIYEAGKKLPPVISQDLARENWEETWDEYVKDTLAADGSEVRVGSGLTIFRGGKSINIGVIAHEALHGKVDI